MRRTAIARTLVERAARADVDALFELVRLWRGLDDRAAFDAAAVVADAQYPHSGLRQMLPLALQAVRGVSVDALRAGGVSGAELGTRLAAARRAAISDALRAADLLT